MQDDNESDPTDKTITLRLRVVTDQEICTPSEPVVEIPFFYNTKDWRVINETQTL